MGELHKGNTTVGYSQMLWGWPGREGGRSRGLSEGNGQMRAAGLQWCGHHMLHLQQQRQGWLGV